MDYQNKLSITENGNLVWRRSLCHNQRLYLEEKKETLNFSLAPLNRNLASHRTRLMLSAISISDLLRRPPKSRSNSQVKLKGRRLSPSGL